MCFSLSDLLHSVWQPLGLSTLFCGDRNGEEIKKRGDICICAVDSLSCTVETNRILPSNYTPIKVNWKSGVVWRLGVAFLFHSLHASQLPSFYLCLKLDTSGEGSKPGRRRVTPAYLHVLSGSRIKKDQEEVKARNKPLEITILHVLFLKTEMELIYNIMLVPGV